MTDDFTITGAASHSTVVTGLTNGSSYNYYVRCIDGSDNENTDDLTISFSVLTDTSAPVRTNAQPGGALSAGTPETTISLSTDETATCRYSTTAGIAYASMTNDFTTTGAASHSTVVTGLSDSSSYNYYVRCIDGDDNENTSDTTISFNVAAVTVVTPPSGGGGGGDTSAAVISNGTPSGTLSSNTTEAVIAVNTNESATCRYSTTAGTVYASMSDEFDSTGGISHSFSADGFTPGNTYTYYIRCRNSASLVTSADYVVAFNIDSDGSGTDTDLSIDTDDDGDSDITIDDRSIRFKSWNKVTKEIIENNAKSE